MNGVFWGNHLHVQLFEKVDDSRKIISSFFLHVRLFAFCQSTF